MKYKNNKNVNEVTTDKVLIFDTTLRDGEQSPGCSMNLEEKLRIAETLQTLGVDIIEAGFAIASNGDFESIKKISDTLDGPIICSLSRAAHKDIDRSAEALRYAKRKRIHTFLSTSPLHMKYKLQMEPEDVLNMVIDSVSYARNKVEDVEWSPEDGSRTEHDFLCRCVEAAITAGATTINIPDTVGYAIPEEFGSLIKMIKNRVPNIDKAIISVHCHNDLGLAVANSLESLKEGARQIECTINGIGERAGNTSLEEVVMAIKTRKDLLPYSTNINTEVITRSSRLLSTITGFSVQPNKAIVGANAFAHESGIHQDGMLKHAGTYEIMTPESVGLNKSTLVMGKHSGRHAFKAKLNELGYEVSDNQLNDAFHRFKDLSDKKKDMFDDDIIALVDDGISDSGDFVKLNSLSLTCGSNGPAVAKLSLTIFDTVEEIEINGDGPVDAVFKGISSLVEGSYNLQLFAVNAVTEGTDAQAEVTVRLMEDGRSVNGQAADTDTMVAAARAYISALNKLIVKREKKSLLSQTIIK
ncbi:MAG TPA: 2-isopropylmalate synthase [Alphaproteobacteria bacterium]|jgi:2-isopropylmalate synthase|nr:2-isopropylmalate synthase [Alphaproteobacteria bacterium]HIK87633.1 2-isopropylmalate synthase [Alphaproteobacteria bacterium]